ncbi:NADP-dependent oxidoreductase domain-containing protein [Fusarium venenatum]|uniref:NADP-dependent oxidoreductase domain-containing protein n=1 Tax=Fusarium venenatum TaxID=56646 RepID=UPI001D8E2180|nr:NADP-dependent oxidoreductase domain-containing protein [Fusarium venenatum]
MILPQIGDSSVDPMARFSTPDEVNAFLDVFSKHGHSQIDTAAVYSPGAPYTSEPRIGAVSAGDRFHIDTKADWFEGHTKESVLRDIDNSLRNLKIDQINIYYLQLPERVHPLEPVLEVLNQAHRDGKIKAWGISNYRADEVQRTIEICEKLGFVKPSVYQGHYNPIVRGAEKELFPLLRKHGMAFYAYSPGAGGFFAQKHKSAEPMSRFSGSVSGMTHLERQKLTNFRYRPKLGACMLPCTSNSPLKPLSIKRFG